MLSHLHCHMRKSFPVFYWKQYPFSSLCHMRQEFSCCLLKNVLSPLQGLFRGSANRKRKDKPSLQYIVKKQLTSERIGVWSYVTKKIICALLQDPMKYGLFMMLFVDLNPRTYHNRELLMPLFPNWWKLKKVRFEKTSKAEWKWISKHFILHYLWYILGMCSVSNDSFCLVNIRRSSQNTEEQYTCISRFHFSNSAIFSGLLGMDFHKRISTCAYLINIWWKHNLKWRQQLNQSGLLSTLWHVSNDKFLEHVTFPGCTIMTCFAIILGSSQNSDQETSTTDLRWQSTPLRDLEASGYHRIVKIWSVTICCHFLVKFIFLRISFLNDRNFFNNSSFLHRFCLQFINGQVRK